MNYCITVQNGANPPVEQEAIGLRLCHKWILAFKANGWAVLRVTEMTE